MKAGSIVALRPGESLHILRPAETLPPLFTALDRCYYAPIEDEL